MVVRVVTTSQSRVAAIALSLLVSTVLAFVIGPGPRPAVANTERVAVATTSTPDLNVAPARANKVVPVAPELSLLLVEVASGQILVAQDDERRRPVASAIKLLTALTVVDLVPADTLITIGEEIRNVEGANFGLRVGEVWSVDDLLVALLLRSGNEVAVSLATAAAGDEARFAREMTRILDDLGVTGAAIETASGLSPRDELSAQELALVARAALREPRIAGMLGQRSTTIAQGAILVENRNLLVGRYAGATGLKTGFTSAAGFTLAASASRDGRELIAIVLGAASEEERLRLSAALLDHGFDLTERRQVRGTLELRSGTGPVQFVVGGTEVTTSRASVIDLAWPASLRPGDDLTAVGLRIDGKDVGAVTVVRADARDPARGSSLGAALAEGVYTGLRAAGLVGALG